MSNIERVLHRLKLSDLRLLQAVVQRGGMAKAAAHLNISQPAVSKAISGLERTLGVKLLDRLAGGVRPTIYGDALLRGNLYVFDDLKQSLRELEFIADASVGEISVGATEPGAAGFVPLVIDEFMQRWPRINVHVVTAIPDLLADRELRGRTIELAIGAMRAIQPSSSSTVE